jgi:hypothetical protein
MTAADNPRTDTGHICPSAPPPMEGRQRTTGHGTREETAHMSTPDTQAERHTRRCRFAETITRGTLADRQHDQAVEQLVRALWPTTTPPGHGERQGVTP